MPRLVTRLVGSPSGRAGLALCAGFLAVALAAPWLTPYAPDVDTAAHGVAPCLSHPFGTSAGGFDILSRILAGTRLSLGVSGVAVLLAALLGTFLGIAAGFRGGWLDRGVSAVIDFFLAVPRLLVLLVMGGLYSPREAPSWLLMALILGATGWMGIARIVRAEARSLRGRDFVLAARGLGLPDLHILRVHVLPNVFAPVAVATSLAVGSTILLESTLSYLGLGLSGSVPSWGGILVGYRGDTLSAWWETFFPGMIIALAVIGFNLLGDGLRDALDPRGRRDD